MLSYQTLNTQIRRLVLETMKDGDKAFSSPKVIAHMAHNFNDHRYVAYALAGVCNGYGDRTLRVLIGDAVVDIDICGETSCVYYEKSSDYCWAPKRKFHADVKVTFVRWANSFDKSVRS